MPDGPAYSLDALVKACSIRGAVFLYQQAVQDANADFNLRTEREVLGFIANGGLEDPAYHSTVPLRLNNQDCGAMVDSYFFYSGPSYGYLAFFLAKTSKWAIKSFKKNDRPDPRSLTDPRNFPFLRAFSGKGGLIDEKK
jgi:hypothetical protein